MYISRVFVFLFVFVVVESMLVSACAYGKGARFDPRNYMAPTREWATLAWMTKRIFTFFQITKTIEEVSLLPVQNVLSVHV